MGKIIDISQRLDAGTPVWPGDTAFATSWAAQLARGDSSNVGSVTMSLHTGTHVDAPLHVLSPGASIDAALDAYIGPALVVDAIGAPAIAPSHVKSLPAELPERVLFRTRTDKVEQWSDDFAYFSPEAARLLVARGVRLVGIDTPSIDKSDSKTLESHKIFAAAGVALLENIVLDHVPPGTYELIALPLKLAGMDASPVRAILRTYEG